MRVQQLNVHNLMEEIVRSCLKELLIRHPKLAECTDANLSDILAIALNQLPPKYVATPKGEVFAKTQLRSQMETDVNRELAYAVEKVMGTPRNSIFLEEEQ